MEFIILGARRDSGPVFAESRVESLTIRRDFILIYPPEKEVI